MRQRGTSAPSARIRCSHPLRTDKKKHRRSQHGLKREAVLLLQEKDERIHALEQQLRLLQRREREVEELRAELAAARREQAALAEAHAASQQTWQSITGVSPGEQTAVLAAASACAAAARGDVRTLKVMLEHDTDIHQADYASRTALHLASMFGHEECVRFLIEAGAPLMHYDVEGRRPLQEAIRFQWGAIAQAIEEAETREAAKLLDISFNAPDFLPASDERKYSIAMSLAREMNEYHSPSMDDDEDEAPMRRPTAIRPSVRTPVVRMSPLARRLTRACASCSEAWTLRATQLHRHAYVASTLVTSTALSAS